MRNLGQKLIGLGLIGLSVLVTVLTGEGTHNVITIPLGLCALLSKERVLN